jgi:uncharacterized protein YdeI (BOF family)
MSSFISPNAAQEMQDYLRLSFNPTPSREAEELLDWGWHRVNVRPQEYKSYPFLAHQQNLGNPYSAALAEPPMMAMANRIPPGRPVVTTYLHRDGSLPMTGALYMNGNPLYFGPGTYPDETPTAWWCLIDGIMVLVHGGSGRFSFRADGAGFDGLQMQGGRVMNASNLRSQIGVTFDGGGSAISTGQELTIRADASFTIQDWYMMADQTGSIVIDVWKDVWANYPPTNADTITAANEPTISADDHDEDTLLSGWTTAVTAGDVITFHVDSCSTIERCTLILAGNKT